VIRFVEGVGTIVYLTLGTLRARLVSIDFPTLLEVVTVSEVEILAHRGFSAVIIANELHSFDRVLRIVAVTSCECQYTGYKCDGEK
jgi:hypothetical protein